MERPDRFIVSMLPHIHQGRSIRGMILTTILALLPSACWGVYQFGLPALLILAAAVVGALLTEFALCKVTRRPSTVGDLHAVLVGLMLGMMIPAGAPAWIALVGGVTAILLGKAPFGPLGSAPLSPALVGLLILVLSWPQELNQYAHPRSVTSEVGSVELAPAETPQGAVLVDRAMRRNTIRSTSSWASRPAR